MAGSAGQPWGKMQAPQWASVLYLLVLWFLEESGSPPPPHPLHPASCISCRVSLALICFFFFFSFWFLLSMQRRLKVVWLCSMALLCYKIRGESLTKPIQETKQHLLTSQKGGPNDAKRCIFCSKSGSWPGHSLTPLSCPLCPFCPTNWLQWLHFSPFMQTRRCQASSLGRLLFSKSRNV